MKKMLHIVAFLLLNLLFIPVMAQTFNYGTGSIASNTAPFGTAGGTGITVSGNDITVTANVNMVAGTYNFANFTINAGFTVTVTGNAAPLIIRCSGNFVNNGELRAVPDNAGNGVGATAGAAGLAIAGGVNGGIGGAGGSNGTSTTGQGLNFFSSTGIGQRGCGATPVRPSWAGPGGGGGAYGSAGLNGTNGSGQSTGCATGGLGGTATYGNTALTVNVGASALYQSLGATVAGDRWLLAGCSGAGGHGTRSFLASARGAGGGGGASGGAIQIVAQNVTLGAGAWIRCRGGVGGNGSVSTGGNAAGGGGGGGAGGTINIQYFSTYTNNGFAPQVSGGGSGNGGFGTTGTGGSGGNGGSGRSLVEQDIVLCTAPTTQATTFSFGNVTTTSTDITFNRGNGTGGVLVVARASAAPQAPTGGTSYTANSSFGSGSTTAAGSFVVYNSNAAGPVTFNITNLIAGTTYQFSVHEWNTTATCYLNPGLAGSVTIPVCLPPNTQASGISITQTSASANLSWTAGNGTGGHLVLLRQGAAVSADPTQTIGYTGNATFGSGTALGGGFVVLSGAGGSVNVSNLLPSTTYHYSIYTYNTSGPCYQNPALSGSFNTSSCSPVTNASSLTYSLITNNSATANWVRGSGTQVLVIARLTATTRVFPAYNITYTTNTTFGAGTGSAITGAGNFVVYNGTATSVNVTGMANLTNYTFDVYEYNATPNCYWFATPLNVAVSTLDGTTSGGCAASVIRTTGAAVYTTITPATTIQTGNLTNLYYQGGAANTPGAGIPIGFSFVYNGTAYTTFGLCTNGFIWFGSGVPNPATTNPISNASANLGGSGTIDGIVSAMGTSVNSTFVNPTVNDIGYSVSGLTPNRTLTIQWRGYTPSNAGSNFVVDQNRQDFQIILNENGGANSNQIRLSYADQTLFGVIFTTASAQVGLRGTSNASFTNRTGAANANWGLNAGTLNTDVCTVGSNNFLNSNVSLNFTQAVTTGPTINGFASGGIGSNTCPATDILLTAGTGFTSYQWFINGVTAPGPGSSAAPFTADASGNYTVVGKNGSCYAQSNPFAVTITACTATWEGDVNSDWNIAGNWSSNAVPTATTDVIINPVVGPNVYPLISAGGNGVCRDFTMTGLASLSIDAPRSLVILRNVSSAATAQIQGLGTIHLNGTAAQTLTGNLTYPILRIDNAAGVSVASGTQTIALALELRSGTFSTNNTVTLRSNTLATAYLDNFSVGFTGTLSGNITVQRYIPGGLGYRYFSSPISAASNLNVTNLGGFVSGANGIIFNPAATPAAAGFPTCWVYNEDDANAIESPNAQWGWVSATNASNLLSPMKGFALNLSRSTTISLTGIPSNGTVTPIAISNTPSSNPTSDGFNLIGNPYPSPISWNALRGLAANTGQFSNIIKYWSNSGQYSGQYADYNGIVGTNGGGDIIPLGQAVMIRKTTAGIGSFNLTNSARVASSSASA
jgi:hypothetical protein